MCRDQNSISVTIEQKEKQTMSKISYCLMQSAKSLLISWAVIFIVVIGSSVTASASDYPIVNTLKAFLGASGDDGQVADRSIDVCTQAASRAYQRILEEFNSGKHTSLETLKAGVEALLQGTTPRIWDLALVPLESGLYPTVLIKFHCAVGVVEGYSSFRIFKYVSGEYRIAASSEQQPILSQVDRWGLPVDHGLLTVTLLDSPNASRQFILTEWQPIGNKPGPHSFIIWAWDGKSLRPIWHRFDLILGHLEIVGRVIALSWRDRDQDILEDGTVREAIWKHEMYQLSDEGLLFDGALSQQLIERYLRDQVIVPKDAESFKKLADLWYAAGAINKAISLYEQALKSGSDERFRYLYLFVADLYEKQGQYREAVEVLSRYRDLAKEKLTSEEHQKIDSRIQELQKKLVPGLHNCVF